VVSSSPLLQLSPLLSFFTVLKLIPVPDAIALSVFLVRFDGVLKWFFTILRGTVAVALNLIEKGDGVGS
ncbi:hypothetical protein, partial [Enterococcus faecium]|uniref:hypothetical protein n=1 Tax=Enterococcus faecium TaxID=1352 RepID=UPI001C612497